MSEITRPLDVLVWGATGFTGKLVAEYLATHYGAGDLRWGLGGRSLSKLEEVRASLARMDTRFADLPLLVADAHDVDSLRKVVAQTRAVCSTVGPFAIHGSLLVAACVQEQTHYADITGEPQWIVAMIDAHHDAAKAAHARIVPCCGFDSIPSDLGTQMMVEHLREHHQQATRSVHAVFGPLRGQFSGGTFASILHLVEQAARDPKVRKILMDPYAFDPKDSKKTPPSPDQNGPAFDPDLRCWTAPFLMSPVNTRMVRRSNALLERSYGSSFVYKESMRCGSGPQGFLAALGVSSALVGGLGVATIPVVRKALQKYVLPSQGDGPSKEVQERGFFRARLVAEGEGGVKVQGRLAGQRDPGYAETAKMLAEAVLCLALDQDRLPSQGGVLTPASAMGKVLRERLVRAGMTFEVVE